MEFNGKVCFITGGAKGIGRSIAEELLKRGAKVFIGDVDTHGMKTCEKELGEQFGADKIFVYRLDVTSLANFEAAFEKCVSHFNRIDLMVNNAGVFLESSYETMIGINFTAVVHGTKLAIKYMGKDQGHDGGTVFNLASVAGLLSDPFAPVYWATKAAVVSYTRCAGHPTEFDRHGVRVLCICPGYAVTNLWDHRRANLSELYDGIFQGFAENKDKVLDAEYLGQAAMTILAKGSSGSAWVVLNKETEPYEMQNELTGENMMKNMPK